MVNEKFPHLPRRGEEILRGLVVDPTLFLICHYILMRPSVSFLVMLYGLTPNGFV